MQIFIIIFFVLLGLELIYFKIADRYGITDHPNHRSSHNAATIRGGGIIISLSVLLAPIYFGWKCPYFIAGLLLVSVISFIDDVKPVSRRIRITFHLIAAALLLKQLGMHDMAFYWLIAAAIIIIGAINAVNFMDGINGITGGFGFVTLLTLMYINSRNVSFTEQYYLLLPVLAIIIFNFFNFRTRAKCFAGDIGSVSLAFIIVFFLLGLILKTKNLNYLLLMLIYGLDTVTTMLSRIIKNENIFEPHRSHFYQFLVNENKMPHLPVAVIYSVVQAIVNVLVIVYLPGSIVTFIILASAATLIFLLIRLKTEGANRLFYRNE